MTAGLDMLNGRGMLQGPDVHCRDRLLDSGGALVRAGLALCRSAAAPAPMDRGGAEPSGAAFARPAGVDPGGGDRGRRGPGGHADLVSAPSSLEQRPRMGRPNMRGSSRWRGATASSWCTSPTCGTFRGYRGVTDPIPAWYDATYDHRCADRRQDLICSYLGSAWPSPAMCSSASASPMGGTWPCSV